MNVAVKVLTVSRRSERLSRRMRRRRSSVRRSNKAKTLKLLSKSKKLRPVKPSSATSEESLLANKSRPCVKKRWSSSVWSVLPKLRRRLPMTL
jgi:hypothetical protein